MKRNAQFFYVLLLLAFMHLEDLALGSSNSCASDGTGCLNPTHDIGDDDESLSNISLLQMKLEKDNHRKERDHISKKKYPRRNDLTATQDPSLETHHVDVGCRGCIALYKAVHLDGVPFFHTWIHAIQSDCERVEANQEELPMPQLECKFCTDEWNAMCASAAYNDTAALRAHGGLNHDTAEADDRTEYVIGTPGGPWTAAEVMAVKAKFWRLFAVGEGELVYNDELQTGKVMNARRDLLRLAAKLVRLAFHDCHRYDDGNSELYGGCDGCLKWQGMGKRFDASQRGQGLENENHGISHNNGLMPTVEMIERIYLDPAFPAKTPVLGRSLKQVGISRADLWALGGIVGVEYGIYTNNHVCDNKMWEKEWYTDWSGLGFSSTPHCHHEDLDYCHVELPRPLQFTYGRIDCNNNHCQTTSTDDTVYDEDYKTCDPEVHADAILDGAGSARFFQEQFGFTGPEAVAILGSHTMGRIHYENTMFRYNWVKNGDGLFNNQYYRNMVSKKMMRFVGNSCDALGDWEGNPAQTRWLARVNNDNTEGGPYQFVQEIKTCPDICAQSGWNSDLGAAAGCNPTEKFKCTQGTEQWILGNLDDSDHTFVTALGAEMGLYLNFSLSTDEDGHPVHLPTGCPGLVNFTFAKFHESRDFWFSTINGTKDETHCAKQELAFPGDTKPLYEVWEEFADYQNEWLKAFVPAWEKMQRNGYRDLAPLPLGPDQFTDIKCPAQDERDWDHRYWVCYNKEKLQAPVMLRSLHDSTVITERPDLKGGIYLEELVEEGIPNHPLQVWQKTETNGHFINMWSKRPLVIDGKGTFEWSETHDTVLLATTPSEPYSGVVEQAKMLRMSASNDVVGLDDYDPSRDVHESARWEEFPVLLETAQAMFQTCLDNGETRPSV